MRKYTKDGRHQLELVVCNQCGRKLLVENHILREGVCSIRESWGYFSDKDGEIHCIDLCEKCYDEWVRGFRVPVERQEETELLGV